MQSYPFLVFWIFISIGHFIIFATIQTKPIISEPQLVERLKARDKLALNYLYEHYSGALFGAVFRIVNHKSVAEEVLQDGFIKVWDKINQYDSSKGKLYTWMLNIFRNLAIDKTRSKEYSQGGKTNPIDNFVYDFDRKNFDQIIEDRIGVDRLLKEVTDDQKEILDLVYFKGYSQSQIAKKYNIPLGTVKSRLRAGLIKLKKIVGVES